MTSGGPLRPHPSCPDLGLTTRRNHVYTWRIKSETFGGVAVAVSPKCRLESLLTERGLGSTLLPAWRVTPEMTLPGAEKISLAPGTITELVSGSAGRGGTSFALRLAASFPGRVAWLDPADRLNPFAVARAGLNLRRFLWVRGGEAMLAVRATQLVLQAGGFSLIVLDLLDHKDRDLRFPRSTWFRLLRALERERWAAMLVVAPQPVAGTCSDQVIAVRYAELRWNDAAQPLVDGAKIEAQIQTARRLTARQKPTSVGTLVEEFVA